MNNKTSKIRLDTYLHDKGFFDSREKARIAIMEGKVFVNNQKEDKPGTMIKEDSEVIVKGEKLKYVSRGGYKLEKAIDKFKIDLTDKICADIGSSTGGFTDCMLQNKAKKVFAIDCGTNQLDYKLRTNENVVTMENTNARYIKETDLGTKVDFISIDVSFISLDKMIDAVNDILSNKGTAVFLIKPQFEAGKELVEKNGVIKDKKVHADVIEKVVCMCKDKKFNIKGLDFSPIKGPAGNIEYLIYIGRENKETINAERNDIEKLVSISHEELDK